MNTQEERKVYTLNLESFKTPCTYEYMGYCLEITLKTPLNKDGEWRIEHDPDLVFNCRTLKTPCGIELDKLLEVEVTVERSCPNEDKYKDSYIAYWFTEHVNFKLDDDVYSITPRIFEEWFNYEESLEYNADECIQNILLTIIEAIDKVCYCVANLEGYIKDGFVKEGKND